MADYVTWKLDFRDKIDYEELNKKIDSFIKQNPKIQLVIEVPSTKGATSSCLRKLDNRVKIRIAGAFDDKRVENYKNVVYKSGARCKEAYVDSVIYTRNETIKILEEIEKIEKGILPNWSDLQKMIYIYDTIKTTIMYDPKYQSKSWAETRTLRGLLTKQTVCAGYAVILKEMLERQGISCMYVSGNGHAWNVIIIDDVMYPVDLTHDNYYFRHGHKNTHMFLGQKPSEFNKNHIPAQEEPDTEHIKNLTELDSKIVEKISSDIEIIKNHTATSQIVTRDDGTKFYIAQIGGNVVTNSFGEDVVYYKYYFQELDNKSKPTVLYSRVNINKYINTIMFGGSAPDGYENAVTEILFSRENIEDSKRRNTSYIGKAMNDKNEKAIRDKSEIVKSKEEIQHFKLQERVFYRKDGSKILAEKLEIQQMNGRTLHKNQLYEMIKDGKVESVRSYIVYSELDLIRTTNLNVADDLLSKERIEKKCAESGGYIGYIDQNNTIKYSRELSNYFDINKRIEVSQVSQDRPLIMPSFRELEDYAREYDVLMSTKTNSIVVIKTKTKKEVQNERKKQKIIFAHIWYTSASSKRDKLDSKPGIKDAFSKEKEQLFNQLKAQMLRDIQYYGTIDSLALYSKYRTTQYSKVILKLFRNEFSTKTVHQLFNATYGYKKPLGLTPQILQDEKRASELLQTHRKY